jgi:predicted TIM-barrel fold metal-dependent hydrolase
MPISRRTFASGLAAAATTPTLAQTPRRLIVDAQIHLWKAESEDWKWVPGMTPQLPEPFTIEKLVPLMDEAGVDRCVIVPPSWPGDRNDYALEAARRYPDRFRVMGRITLRNPAMAAQLPTWKQQQGMLGIRVTFLGADAGMLTDGAADWFWPAAEKAGLPVMFYAPGRSAIMAPIAERHPGLQLIVDHSGVVGTMAKEGTMDAALAQTVALAKYPNVSVKLSAWPAASQQSYPWEDVKSWIKRAFDAFGPNRSFWGTDLTNSWTRGTYRQRVTHFTETLDFMSEQDKDLVMGKAILAKLGWS